MQNQTKTKNAVKFLEQHGQDVVGVAGAGVCVIEYSSRMVAPGVYDVCAIGVWVPATMQALRDFMMY